MKVLVTGAAGFLGRHLVDRLMARGDQVLCFDIQFDHPLPNWAEPVAGSITDPIALAKAMKGCDAVIHGAAITSLWTRNWRDYHRINVEGTRTVLDAAYAEGVLQLVHVSSFVTLIAGARQSSGAPDLVDERLELPAGAMLGPYPRSKRLAELLCRNHPLDPVIVLPTAPIGPGDLVPTPPGQMLADLAGRRLPALIDCTWNFVDIRSLADGVIAAMDKGQRGRRYLLGGRNMNTADLAGLFEQVAGVAAPRARVPHAVALMAGHVEQCLSSLTGTPPKGPLTGIRLAGPRLFFDHGRAARELGYKPAPIDAAMRDALACMRERGRVPAM
ncbi:MAG: NAD-dependent epimerase/dehydratase family protein [Pseudomonadota bacterium]